MCWRNRLRQTHRAETSVSFVSPTPGRHDVFVRSPEISSARGTSSSPRGHSRHVSADLVRCSPRRGDRCLRAPPTRRQGREARPPVPLSAAVAGWPTRAWRRMPCDAHVTSPAPAATSGGGGARGGAEGSAGSAIQTRWKPSARGDLQHANGRPVRPVAMALMPHPPAQGLPCAMASRAVNLPWKAAGPRSRP